MKVLYCIGGTYNSAGMERVLAQKANWLVAHGYEVIIVTTEQRGRQPFFPLNPAIRCIDLGINYEENNGKSVFNKLVHFPGKQRRHRRLLTQVLEQERPDVTVSMFCNDLEFINSIPAGGHKVLEVHFSRFRRLQIHRSGLWKLTDIYRKDRDLRKASEFEKFVVLTREDASYWEGLTNVITIPNASPFENVPQCQLNAKRVLAIGRLNYQKGFDTLIDIWAHVSPRMPLWTLTIVGEGEDRDMLISKIQEYGLQDTVELLPATKEIGEIYLGSSILAMTSRYEGLPMALIEAQSFGLPAVAFDCKCGPKEIIDDGINGYLVKEGFTRLFGRRLLSLMADSDLRHQMGQEARQRSARFSQDAIMAQWDRLFKSLVN